MQLNREALRVIANFPDDLKIPEPRKYPERIIQFGEGNFLRAFVDWMIHQMNQQGLFNGSVVVVQPIPGGLIPVINRQDGLYTLFLRGVQKGRVVEKKQIVSSISRGIDPYEHWDEYLRCAENPDMRFVVSNTTEAGISYLPEDFNPIKTPVSFPGKLTAFLYRRFEYFGGDPARGMVIIPCELIDRNGDTLKGIVLRLAAEWNLGEEFASWIRNHNYFCNTLVDRIVTGYPRDEIEDIKKYTGYDDELVNTGEIFHLWVIEGDSRLREELPLDQAGLNVLWVDDITPYRDRKVHILNGSHTMTVPVAFLCGLNMVREAVEDGLVGKFMIRGIFDEIIPTLRLPEKEKVEFANNVLERFKNPFIKHNLIDIALNSTSKFKTRCLPTMLEYLRLKNDLPPMLTFSLAALIAFYHSNRFEGKLLLGERIEGPYKINDALDVLEFFRTAWSTGDIGKVSGVVLGNTKLWGRDLNEIPGMTAAVAVNLAKIMESGMPRALKAVLEES